MARKSGRFRRISPGLVAGLILLTSAAAAAAQSASIVLEPARVVRGGRSTIRIRTSIPWGQNVEIDRPELTGPMVWWAYPYSRPYRSENGERLVEVLAQVRVDQPGFHSIAPFRIRSGDLEEVTETAELIGLNTDESTFPYPVTTQWRPVPETVWQGQAVPVILEAENLVILTLAENTVLNTAPPGLAEPASGFGFVETRPHNNDILYDVPVAAWIWTVNEAGQHTFPGVRTTVAGLTRTTGPFSIEVRPLPESVQASGAVGNFELQTLWDEDSCREGEIFSVRIRIEGEGNLNVLNLPVPRLEGAALVSQGSASSYLPSSGGFSGWREERYDFQVQRSGTLALRVPEWIWQTPQGAIRTVQPQSAAVDALPALEQSISDADMLLGERLVRYRTAHFHWRHWYWFFMLIPGCAVLFYIRRSLKVGLIAILPLFLSAAAVSTAGGRAANQAALGNWDAALSEYYDLYRETGELPGLLHDLAVAEMETGNPGRSVAMIRRAMVLRPGTAVFSDSLERLEHRFGLTDQVPVSLKISPSLIFAFWLLSVNVFLLSLAFIKREGRRVILFVSAVLLLIVSTFSMGFSERRWNRVTAVVKDDSEPLRKIPGPLATDWIRLPSGSAVDVTAVEDQHALVRTGYGLEGWIPLSSLFIVTEFLDGL